MSADETSMRRVGVIGCGPMGSGNAEVTASAGHETLVREVDDTRLAAGTAAIERSLERSVERQKTTPSERDETLARIEGTTKLEDLDGVDLVIEAVLVPFLLDAIRALEEGTGAKEDIDRGMKLGCGHPMGPFELLDFVGLDTTLQVAHIMHDEFRERRFAPPPLLTQMVVAGHLGRKSGRGFYDD